MHCGPVRFMPIFGSFKCTQCKQCLFLPMFHVHSEIQYFWHLATLNIENVLLSQCSIVKQIYKYVCTCMLKSIKNTKLWWIGKVLLVRLHKHKIRCILLCAQVSEPFRYINSNLRGINCSFFYHLDQPILFYIRKCKLHVRIVSM